MARSLTAAGHVPNQAFPLARGLPTALLIGCIGRALPLARAFPRPVLIRWMSQAFPFAGGFPRALLISWISSIFIIDVVGRIEACTANKVKEK